LYHNFTDLPDGVHNYSAYAINVEGGMTITPLRTLTIGECVVPMAGVIIPRATWLYPAYRTGGVCLWKSISYY